MKLRTLKIVGGAMLVGSFAVTASGCGRDNLPPPPPPSAPSPTVSASAAPSATPVVADAGPAAPSIPIASASAAPSASAPKPPGGVGQSCGTRGASDCPAPLFCSHQPPADCGRADAPGHCAARPQTCAAASDPVCGCDGKTYDNACKAAMAAVGVDTKGPCRK